MMLMGWLYFVLFIFFIVQGITGSWMIWNQRRIRRSLHRLTNAVQVVAMQLEVQGSTKQADQVRGIRATMDKSP
jgi:heme A synthase